MIAFGACVVTVTLEKNEGKPKDQTKPSSAKEVV